MMNLGEYRHHSQSLADFLPWAALVEKGVVLNKDGSFQRTARFRGPDLDSATPAERTITGLSVLLQSNALKQALQPYTLYNSFSGLGIEAGGGTMNAAQLLQPGKLAQVGIDAGKPILTSISGMMGFTSVFANLVQIIILLVAWMIVVISFFIMAIQLFVSLIEFKLTTLAGFVLVPFGLFGRTAFLAEKVLGNVVSSGVKILVSAVIVGIGSTVFGQFTNGLGTPPTISDALTLILASLALLGLSIFGPGIANGLIAGGPQLGAGAAIGTGAAVAGVTATGAGLAAGGIGAIGAAGSAVGGAARGSASIAGAATTAYRAGGMSGVAEAAGSAAISPLRRAATSMRESFAAGGRAVTAEGSGAATSSQGEAAGPPAWAEQAKVPSMRSIDGMRAEGRRMQGNQSINRGASAAHQAIRSGDHPSSGGGIDLSEGE
jgi:type IV secretion system protein TrbL